MKKLLILALILIFTKSSLFAQVIKIENGIAISSLSSDKVDVLKKNIITYSVSVGMDYWKNSFFYLSSEVGYLKKGGKEENKFQEGSAAKIKESWDYIHLNTTIRFPFHLKKDNSHFFLGVGPKLDVLISSNKFKNTIYTGYKMNTISFGVKAEMGLVQDFDQFRTGINFSYLQDITKAGGTEFLNSKNNAFLVMLSLGYIL
jgi:hypothetical protein